MALLKIVANEVHIQGNYGGYLARVRVLLLNTEPVVIGARVSHKYDTAMEWVVWRDGRSV